MTLNAKQEQYLDTIADFQAEIDDLVENNQEDAALIIRDVLYNAEGHDPLLFELLGLDSETTIDDYSSVPVYERDLKWVGGLSALFVAAEMTAWLELYGVEFLGRIEDREATKRKHIASMSLAEMKEAGRVGINKERINNAKDRRNAR